MSSGYGTISRIRTENTQGPAQKSDARKTAGSSNRALIRCVIFVRSQASLDERRIGGSEAQRARSEPITGP